MKLEPNDRIDFAKMVFFTCIVAIIVFLGGRFLISSDSPFNGFLTQNIRSLLSVCGIVIALVQLFVSLKGKIYLNLQYFSIFAKIKYGKDSRAIEVATESLTAFILQKMHRRRIAVVLVLFAASLSWLLLPTLSVAVMILVAAAIILQLGDLALTYRLRRGLYGTNEYEARQIINFILDNAAEIDLSGGLGLGQQQENRETEKFFNELWETA